MSNTTKAPAGTDDFAININLAIGDEGELRDSHETREVRVKSAVKCARLLRSIRQCGQPRLNLLAELRAQQRIRLPHMNCEHGIAESLRLDH